MNKEDWISGIEAWTRVLAQSKIDQEQAELYIDAINSKIAQINKEDK